MFNKISKLKKQITDGEFRLDQNYKMGFLLSASIHNLPKLSQIVDNLPLLTSGEYKWLQEKLFEFTTLDEFTIWMGKAIEELNALGYEEFKKYSKGQKPSFTHTSGDDASLIDYYQCNLCKSYHKTDDGDCSSYDGLWICPVCHPSVHKNAIRFVGSYEVETNGWKPADHYRKFQKRWNNPLYRFFAGVRRYIWALTGRD